MARLKTVCGVEFLVDKDFAVKWKGFRWTLLNSGYASTTNWCPERKRAVTKTVHELVLGSRPKGLVVDHINNNKLDNRKKNLRYISQQNNSRRSNRKPPSGFRGVNWCKQKEKWRSRVFVDRKEIHCGFFDSIIEAARAYDKKALELFGEYANLNFKE